MLAAFAALALSVSVGSAYATSVGDMPEGMSFTVTSVTELSDNPEYDHGYIVMFKNTGEFELTIYHAFTGYYSYVPYLSVPYTQNTFCDTHLTIQPGQTKPMKLCYDFRQDDHVPGFTAYVYDREVHNGVSDQIEFGVALPGYLDTCERYFDNFCLESGRQVKYQEVPTGPASHVQCVQTNQLTVGTAVYHPVFRDIILTFDTPVWFAEDWRENMSILFENDTGIITVNGLDHTTRNLVHGNSTFAWLSLAYVDYTDFEFDDSHVAEMTLSIDPGTIMYGDGQTLDTRLNVPVNLVP